MRTRSLRIVAALAIVCAPAAAGHATADPDTCKLACQEQFQQDKRECRDRELAAQDASQEEHLACVEEAGGPDDVTRCDDTLGSAMAAMQQERRQCDREAKERRDACRAACDVSPVLP